MQSYSKEEKRFYKKRLRWNVAQLLIGWIFLAFSYMHLQTNIAERASITSGIQVIGQKIELRIRNIFDNDGAVYQDKLNVQSNYDEVVDLVENSSCKDKIPASEVQELDKRDSALKQESIADYKSNLNGYKIFIVDFYQEVTKLCNPSWTGNVGA